jgi:CDP-diglyceride synthetase
MSYAPAVPEGRPRVLSRVAAIVLLPITLTVLRVGQPWWFILALLSVCAFETNRYRVASIAGLLAVVAQLGAILGLLALGVTVAGFAESGRDAPVLRGVTILFILGMEAILVGAFVGAVRTLRSSVAEP